MATPAARKFDTPGSADRGLVAGSPSARTGAGWVVKRLYCFVDGCTHGHTLVGPTGADEYDIYVCPEHAERRRAIVALIPARNEAGQIAATLHSLARQERCPDRIVVVADNCSDDTALIATAHGAEVIETVGNTAKKAGALNQALAVLLPTLDDSDAVLVQDADSQLGREFVQTAADYLAVNPRTGAVGGVFYAATTRTLLEQLQANEYQRYGREISRQRGRVMVLTGTASLIRVAALREVAASRGSRLPGRRGDVYDAGAITEDNELTMALKTICWGLVSPRECRVVTEVMPGWRDLWRQRLRWQRGALDNIRAYGLTRVTVRYWGQQVGLGLGVVAVGLYLLLMGILVMTGQFGLAPVWLGIGGVFLVERVVTVWALGARARLLAAAMLPELVYDLVLMAVYIRSLADSALRRETPWHHVAAEGR